MAIRTMQFKVPPPPKEQAPFELARIDLGINVRDEHSNIVDGQSPYVDSAGRPGALNIVSDGKGGIKKRPGQTKLYTTSLGAGAIHGIWDYTKMSGTVTRIIHHTTKLYTQTGSDQPVELATGIANVKGVAFVFNDLWYYIDGTKYWQYNGTTVTEVVGKAPTIITGRAPTGTGGASNEELNYISNQWIVSFNGTVGDTAYILNAAVDSVDEIKVNGVVVLPATYTFPTGADYAKVTFDVAPGAGTDNVTIKVTDAGTNDATLIKKCKYSSLFGGKNDTRIFITGNASYPSTVFWCALDDPTYWPVLNYNLIGSDADYNSGMAFQYDQLVLLKESSIWRIEYEISATTGLGIFPAYPLNNAVGCNMPGSIQIIDNYIVFCHSQKGPQIIERTDVRTEKNVKSIGDLINQGPGRLGLLDEAKADLLLATSFDDGQHYILCVGSKCWAWDYKNSPWVSDADNLIWWYWESVNANCWIQYDGVICYGDRTVGLVQKFTSNTNDNGVAINGVWRSKLFHFTFPEWLKTISLIYFRTNNTNAGSISVTAYSDLGTATYTKSFTSSSFSWAAFRWDMFSWAVNAFDPVFRIKAKLKKVKYIALEFSNNSLNQDLSILDLKIYFNLNRKVK